MTFRSAREAIDRFTKAAPPIDEVRDDAVRACVETARWLRGEREALRTPDVNPLTAEASDAAFGVAAEVALAVGEAMVKLRAPSREDMPWDVAGEMLRSGWQRGHKIVPHVVRGKGKN